MIKAKSQASKPQALLTHRPTKLVVLSKRFPRQKWDGYACKIKFAFLTTAGLYIDLSGIRERERNSWRNGAWDRISWNQQVAKDRTKKTMIKLYAWRALLWETPCAFVKDVKIWEWKQVLCYWGRPLFFKIRQSPLRSVLFSATYAPIPLTW